jgi:hypothetical protein
MSGQADKSNKLCACILLHAKNKTYEWEQSLLRSVRILGKVHSFFALKEDERFVGCLTSLYQSIQFYLLLCLGMKIGIST